VLVDVHKIQPWVKRNPYSVHVALYLLNKLNCTVVDEGVCAELNRVRRRLISYTHIQHVRWAAGTYQCFRLAVSS